MLYLCKCGIACPKTLHTQTQIEPFWLYGSISGNLAENAQNRSNNPKMPKIAHFQFKYVSFLFLEMFYFGCFGVFRRMQRGMKNQSI